MAEVASLDKTLVALSMKPGSRGSALRSLHYVLVIERSRFACSFLSAPMFLSRSTLWSSESWKVTFLTALNAALNVEDIQLEPKLIC